MICPRSLLELDSKDESVEIMLNKEEFNLSASRHSMKNDLAHFEKIEAHH